MLNDPLKLDVFVLPPSAASSQVNEIAASIRSWIAKIQCCETLQLPQILRPSRFVRRKSEESGAFVI